MRTLQWLNRMVFLLILLPAYAQFDQARWQSLGPQGGTINCLTTYGSDLYAGGYGGVFKSGDSGGQWTDVSDSIPQETNIRDFAIAGPRLVAATSNGVFRLNANGTSWESLNANWPPGVVDSESIGPAIGTIAYINNKLYAGSERLGLFELNNQSWSRVPEVPANAQVFDIAGNSEVLLVATNKGVFRLQGRTWTLDDAIPFVKRLPVGDPKSTANYVRRFVINDQNEIYAAATDSIYLLRNAGAAWEKFAENPAREHSIIQSLYTYGGRLENNGKLFVATEGKVHRFAGGVWTELTQGFTRAGGVNQVWVLPDLDHGDYLFAANDVGINRTSLANVQWGIYNQGLVNTEVKDMLLAGDALYAAVKGAMYVRKGTGEWRELRDSMRTGASPNALVQHQERLYCATTQSVYYLADNGRFWKPFEEGIPDTSRRTEGLASVGNDLFVKSTKGIYRSTNGGPWKWANKGLPNNAHSFEKMAVLGNDLFIFRTVLNDGRRGFYRWDASAEEWRRLPLKPAYIGGLTADGDNLYTILNKGTQNPAEDGVYRSSDKGQTWHLVIDQLTYKITSHITSNGHGSLFSFTTQNFKGDKKRSYEEVNFSKDGGKTWSKISNARLPINVQARAVRATQTELYIATPAHGVWVLPLWDVYPPSTTTGAVTNLTATTVTLNGRGGAEKFGATFEFRYDTLPNLAGGKDIPLNAGPSLGNDLPFAADLKDLRPGKKYYYQLRGVNTGGVPAFGDTLSFETKALTTIERQQKPSDSLVTVDQTTVAPVQVSVTLNEKYQPDTKVFLRVRGLRSGQFQGRREVVSGSRTFTADLPADLLDELGLLYYFEVVPPAGYGKRDTTAAVTVAARYANGKAIENLDFRKKQYQLLAFPLDLDKKSVADVLGQELPAVKGRQEESKWRLVAYRDKGFEPMHAQDRLVPGEAYWLATTENISLPIHTGSGKTVAHHPDFDEDYFAIALNEKGWTLVGNPFPWAVKWSDILAANGGNPAWELVTYQNRRLTGGGELPAYSGGYVKRGEGSPATLKIPVGNGGGRRQAEVPGPRAAMPLAVAFTVQSGEVSTQVAGLGLHPLASAGADKYDLDLPPTPGGMPVLHFVSPAASGLTRSVLPPAGEGQTWEFTVTGTEEVHASVLSWTVKSEPGRQLWLHDLATERKADMLAATSHSFRGPGRFRVYYGPAGYVDQHLRPERNLVQAHPNPFARNTTLRFTLPPGNDGCRVRMTLLDAQGRRLGTVAEGTYGSGFHQVEVPPGRLPAGVYTVEAAFDGPSLRTVQHLKLVRQ